MNAIARASRAAAQVLGARSFAAGAYPERKVAVLGAAGECRDLGTALAVDLPELGSPDRRRPAIAAVSPAAAAIQRRRQPHRAALPCLQAASASPCRC